MPSGTVFDFWNLEPAQETGEKRKVKGAFGAEKYEYRVINIIHYSTNKID